MIEKYSQKKRRNLNDVETCKKMHHNGSSFHHYFKFRVPSRLLQIIMKKVSMKNLVCQLWFMGKHYHKDKKKKCGSLLGVKDTGKVKEITVTGQDLVTYIKGDPHSNMYSSAKITRKDSGEGL